MDEQYQIIRFYKDAGIHRLRRRIIKTGLTLDEAQTHCRDPQTSSSTATNSTATARTRNLGAWFDGYEVQS